MNVLVCGNINSGKSYCISLLADIFNNFSVIQIDEWRKKYSDGTFEGEQNARKKFIHEVITSKNAFVELSGMGPLGKELAEKIESKSFIMLYMKENVETCLSRLSLKYFSNTPYPKFDETIDNTIRRIDSELHEGELYTTWKDKALSILEITKDYKIHEIPLMHYKCLIIIIKKIRKNEKIKEIVLYGSLVQNTLTNLSDVDMFITTDYSAREIENMLHDIDDCTFTDTTENKVTVMFNDILIEIVVVKNINDNICYYVNSNIKDVSSTIIKGNNETFNTLSKAVLQFSPNLEELKEEAIKRLVYFLLSMKKIIKKGDKYKFFFHNNIIIHEITRLLYFCNNKIEHDYLPNMALNYYGDINIKDLIYDFEKDMHEHFLIIRCFVKKVLEKVTYNKKKYFDIL